MAYKYNDEQPMTRMTCRDEYGNADIIGLEDVMHEFMLSLDYPDMVHLTEALNRFADLEESKIEALQEQKTGKWIKKAIQTLTGQNGGMNVLNVVILLCMIGIDKKS